MRINKKWGTSLQHPKYTTLACLSSGVFFSYVGARVSTVKSIQNMQDVFIERAAYTKARLLDLTPYQTKVLREKRRKIEDQGVFCEEKGGAAVTTSDATFSESVGESPLAEQPSKYQFPKTLTEEEARELEERFRRNGK